ncbi:MAG TPA: DUF3822 family protein [Chitinophagaceae bacterium]|nr:DUF3822 family protein [Chitinophagaceae bacterium]
MKQLFHIKGTQSHNAAEDVLSLRIGQKHFSFAITDKSGRELRSLGYYSNEDINAETLGSVYAKHPELYHSFHAVQLCYDYPDSLLVPEGYQPEDSGILLSTVYGSHSRTSIITEAVDERKLHNVYAVPADVREWVTKLFPACSYQHHYTMAIKMMPDDSADHLLIDFTPAEFSFIVLKENKILIAQTLSYTTPEDILYYLLKTCNQFSLSRDEVQLYISGMIEKESQLYRELYLYFMNVSFRDPSWTFSPGDENREYPAHFFTTLNDLAQCAS